MVQTLEEAIEDELGGTVQSYYLYVYDNDIVVHGAANAMTCVTIQFDNN